MNKDLSTKTFDMSETDFGGGEEFQSSRKKGSRKGQDGSSKDEGGQEFNDYLTDLEKQEILIKLERKKRLREEAPHQTYCFCGCRSW